MTLHKNFYKACELNNLDPVTTLHYLVDVFIFDEEPSCPDIDSVFISVTKDNLLVPKMNFFTELKSKKAKTAKAASKDNEFMSFIQEYRNIFKGIRHRSEGVRMTVIEKMLTFLDRTDYTKEQILSAAKYHVQEAGSYAMNADNFIYHDKKGSQLLEVLESGDYAQEHTDGRELI